MSTMLGALPLELWLQVGHCLQSNRDLSALARTSRALYSSLQAHRIRYDAQQGGSSALLWASAMDRESLIRASLAAGADVNATLDGGQTPLHLASHWGNGSIVTLLLAQTGILADIKDDQYVTPLLCAASQGHHRIVERLLERSDVSPNPCRSGFDSSSEEDEEVVDLPTPLTIAASKGYVDVVAALVACDRTQVNFPNAQFETPLYLAADNGHEEIVQTLLDTGKADVNHQNDAGESSIIRAAARGRVSLLQRLLLDPHADLELEDNNGMTALAVAFKNGLDDVVRVILNSGKADADKLGEDGDSLLGVAAKVGDEAWFKTLLASGDFDVSARNVVGDTLLITAVKGGSLEIVKLVMEAGKVDVAAESESSETAFSIAVDYGLTEIAEYLAVERQQ